MENINIDINKDDPENIDNDIDKDNLENINMDKDIIENIDIDIDMGIFEKNDILGKQINISKFQSSFLLFDEILILIRI